MKAAGARGFDAYAHHPYYGRPSETPSTPPPPGIHGNAATAVTLGNFSLLTREVTRLYGNKRIWITEYGYQTNPPDRLFGVSFAKQALYLKQSYAIAKKNPRVDMFLWFLLRDEVRYDGWQSGLLTASGGRSRPTTPSPSSTASPQRPKTTAEVVPGQEPEHDRHPGGPDRSALRSGAGRRLTARTTPDVIRPDAVQTPHDPRGR